MGEKNQHHHALDACVLLTGRLNVSVVPISVVTPVWNSSYFQLKINTTMHHIMTNFYQIIFHLGDMGRSTWQMDTVSRAQNLEISEEN